MKMNQEELENKVMRIFDKQISEMKKDYNAYVKQSKLDEKNGNDVGAVQNRKWAREVEIEMTALKNMQIKLSNTFVEINNVIF